MDKNSLLIVGTGAMASLFAARFAAVGIQVTMLGTWQEGLQALERYGVRILESDGKIHAYPVKVIEKAEDAEGVRPVLVLVKSWQTERVTGQLQHCLAEDGLVLTLQNGLGNYELLSEKLGTGRVAVGSMTLGAYLEEPGLVHPVWEGVINLGVHERLDLLADPLEQAGFEIHTLRDITSLMWGKLVINAAINPLTALLRIPNGELLTRPAVHNLLVEAACEAAQVAGAYGVRLPYANPVPIVEDVARRTAYNRSSMLQDVLRGMPTEIDVINGAIVRAGEQAGIPTPVNRILWELIRGVVEEI